MRINILLKIFLDLEIVFFATYTPTTIDSQNVLFKRLCVRYQILHQTKGVTIINSLDSIFYTYKFVCLTL